MTESVLLVFLLLIPALGAAAGALLPPGNGPRYWALFVSIVTALLAIALAGQFDWQSGAEMRWGFTSSNPFSVDSLRFGLKLGADSVSLWLVLLTVLLTVLSVAASFASIRQREKEYYAWMLLLLMAMNGVFIARDLLLFYIFFELTLIPMFFIIGIWGGPERRYAAAKFFLFTFTGSVFALAAIIYLGITSPQGFELNQYFGAVVRALPPHVRFWLFLALLAGFAVKVPLFPLHTWLPLAHTEAPTAGSVILAGVLLKLGTYGIYKIAMPVGLLALDLKATIFDFYLIPPWQLFHITIQMMDVLTWIAVLCLVGIIYAALVAWVQNDIKKLVAYSSVSHLGFCVLGLAALNVIGISGGILYMINHGLSTGALFLVVGMIYDRYHTRDINELSGLARKMPILAFFFVLFALASIGLPGLNGFVNEFLTVLGAFTSNHLGPAYGAVAALGIILGALYMLHMVARVIWGPLKVPAHAAHEAAKEPLPQDIGGREIAVLVPIAIAVVALGIYPNIVLKTIEKPAQAMETMVAERPARASASTGGAAFAAVASESATGAAPTGKAGAR